MKKMTLWSICLMILAIILYLTICYLINQNKIVTLSESPIKNITYDMGYFYDIKVLNNLDVNIVIDEEFSTESYNQNTLSEKLEELNSVNDNLFTIEVTGLQTEADNIQISNNNKTLEIGLKELPKKSYCCVFNDSKQSVTIKVKYPKIPILD